MAPEHTKTSLKPIIAPDARLLILGSMPGDISLAENQYYANPRNHFWKIMFEILGQRESADYQTRIDLLLSHRIALWDILASCERQGSLDANIRNVALNDIAGLLAQHPGIETLVLNGGEADRRLNKKYRQTLSPRLRFVRFPSTSPVPGRNVLSYEEKVQVWRGLLDWL